MTDLDPQDVIELLQSMVRINSINRALPGSIGGEAELASWIEAWSTKQGFAVLRLPVEDQCDQLLICYELASDLPWLLMDSHLDTVAVEGMTIDPFGGASRAGRVWGRGSADTKGTGAAMLWALKRYANSGQGLNNVAVLLSVDEEVTMQGIRSFVDRDLPNLGWRPAAAVVGEPTELRTVVAHNGCLRWDITTHGKACHSSVPHEGVSAISVMTRVIALFEEHYIPSLDAEHVLTGRAVCSINMIRGGSAPNIIPASCHIVVDRRTVPGESVEQIDSKLREMLSQLRLDESSSRIDVEVQLDQPPLGTAHNQAWAAKVTETLNELSWSTLQLGAPFATNAAHLDAVGIPTVVIGPGSPHTAHTADEWVEIDQIRRGVDLYHRLMIGTLPERG